MNLDYAIAKTLPMRRLQIRIAEIRDIEKWMREAKEWYDHAMQEGDWERATSEENGGNFTSKTN